MWRVAGLPVASGGCLEGDWGPVFRSRWIGERSRPKHMALDYNDV